MRRDLEKALVDASTANDNLKSDLEESNTNCSILEENVVKAKSEVNGAQKTIASSLDRIRGLEKLLAEKDEENDYLKGQMALQQVLHDKALMAMKKELEASLRALTAEKTANDLGKENMETHYLKMVSDQY